MRDSTRLTFAVAVDGRRDSLHHPTATRALCGGCVCYVAVLLVKSHVFTS